MFDDFILNRVLDKIKEIISIEMFHETTIMIVTGDKLTDDTPFKNAVILITCVIKDDGKCYPQMFLEEAKHGNNTRLNELC